MRTAIILATLLTLMSVPATGQDCIDYTEYTRWVAEAPFAGTAGGVDVVGDFLYVVNKDFHSVGMTVFDITDPLHPAAMGSTPAPGQNYDIAVAGDHAYVTSNDGLEIINIRYPTIPYVVGSIGTPHFGRGLAVSGEHVFVAAEDSGLVVIDVTVPSAPVQVGHLPLPLHTRDVVVVGDLAYVANYNLLRVVDVSDPTDPQLVGSAAIPGGYSSNLAVAGNHAYMGAVSSGRGLHAFDVTDPAAPVLTSSVDGFDPYDVTLVGDAALVAGSRGLTIIDISDPTDLRVETHVPVTCRFVATGPGYAYLGGGTTTERDLQVVELGELGAPDPLGTYADLDYVYLVKADGDVVFPLGTVGTNDWHLDAVDASDPAAPVRVDRLRFGHGVHKQGFDVDAGLAALKIDEELHIVDVSNLTDMRLLSTTTVDDYFFDLSLEGSLLCAAATVGLRIYDIADPTRPEEVGVLEFYNATDVDVVGSLAYVSGEGFGLKIVDVSDPAAPFVRADLSANQWYYAVDVVGSYAYLGGNHEYAIADISNPDSPYRVAYGPLPWESLDIARIGNTMCVALLGQQVQIFDVSTPTSPVVLGNTGDPLPSRAFAVADASGRIVVAAEGAGVTIFPEHCWLTGVDGNDTPDPVATAALMVWPNPFNPRTTIAFTIDASGPVDLAIYDVAGRLVQQLLAQDLRAGPHEVEWDGRGVRSGVFFCRLATAGRIETRKLTLLK